MTDRTVPTEPTLLPCPFCGDRMIYGDASNFLGEALHTVEHSGESDTSEDCVLWTIKSWPTRQEAAEAWNRRTASPAAPGAEVEPVAWCAFAENGNVRLWEAEHARQVRASGYFLDMRPLYLSPPTTDAIKAQARREALEDVVRWHESEIARLDRQIEENIAYGRRSGHDLTASAASDFCRDSIIGHRLAIDEAKRMADRLAPLAGKPGEAEGYTQEWETVPGGLLKRKRSAPPSAQGGGDAT